MRSFTTVLVLMLLTAAYVRSQNVTLEMPILMDLSIVSGTSNPADTLNGALVRFLSGKLNATMLGTPRVYDTSGSLLMALTQLQNIITGPQLPRCILIADFSADISTAVVSMLKSNIDTASIIVVPLLSADAALCDAVAYPNVLCPMPRDRVNVRAIFDLGYNYFAWRSVGVVVSNDPYGRGVLDAIGSETAATSARPTIVAQQVMGSTTDSDVATLQQLTQNKPVVILAFVSKAEAARLQAAQARLGITGLFWLWSKATLSLLPTLSGNIITHEPMTGALLVPQFTLPSDLIAAGVVSTTIDAVMAMVLSYSLDSLRLIAQGGAGASASTLRGMVVSTPTVFTGTSIAFDAITGERTPVEYRLISALYQATPIARWSRAGVDASSVVSLASFATALVAPSPLRAVTVCILGSSSCSDVADVVRILSMYYLINDNQTRQTSVIVRLINTGPQGVIGLPTLLDQGSSCQVALGPGRAKVNLIVSPVLTYFQVAQLTYALASTAFDSDRRFPLYSRVSASDVDMASAVASAAQYFAWGRVLVISSDDEYGAAASAVYVDAMEQKTVLIERVYLVTDVGSADFFNALVDIRDRAISRIVVVAMSMTDATFSRFTAAFQSLGMLSTTIFIFSNPICRYLAIRPQLRLPYVSSICVTPTVDPAALAQADRVLNTSYNTQVDAMLSDARMQPPGCNYRSTTPFAAYTYDAASVIVQAIQTAVTGGLDTFNASNWVRAIRDVVLPNPLSGAFTFSSSGTRVGTTLTVNVQEPSGAVTPFLSFNSATRPSSIPLQLNHAIVWLDNTTDIPPASIRVVTFIATSTIRDNPGTIVLSVLGFVGTIAVFVLCYRQYKTQLEVERRLNAIVAEQKYKSESLGAPPTPATAV